MNRKLVKTLLGGAAMMMAATIGTTAGASAVELPCSTAKLVVPWGAGGGTGVIFGIFEKAIDASDAPVKVKVVTV
ncbi:MAG: hypothetical protein ABJ360_00610, partial [Roseobacter sp.]